MSTIEEMFSLVVSAIWSPFTRAVITIVMLFILRKSISLIIIDDTSRASPIASRLVMESTMIKLGRYAKVT